MLCRDQIIDVLHSTFLPMETAHFHVGCGAALCLHGLKLYTNDIDLFCDSLDALNAIATRLETPIQPSRYNGKPRLQFTHGEMFFDPDLVSEYRQNEPSPEVIIDGFRVDSLAAIHGWYKIAASRFNRQKDHDHLAMVSERLQWVG